MAGQRRMTRRLAYTALWFTLWPLVAIIGLLCAAALLVWLLPGLVGSIWQFDWERK